MDHGKNEMEYLELNHILETWQISQKEFIYACILAGTEYNVAYPYVNLGNTGKGYI